MLLNAQLRRLRATANESQSTEIPVVQMGPSVEDFFKDLEQATEEGSTLPNWCVSMSGLLLTKSDYNATT